MTVDVLDDNLRKKRVNKIFQRLRLSLKQYLKFGVLNNDYPKTKTQLDSKHSDGIFNGKINGIFYVGF